jgi:hypothetical protein
MTPIGPALPVTCPSCRAQFPWRHVSAGLFHCPGCGSGLRLAGGYFRVVYLAALATITLIAYASGVRGDALLATAMLVVWPTYLLLLNVNVRLFPPDVEATGDVRGILYPVNPDDVPAVSEPPVGAEEDPSSQAPARPGRDGMFASRVEHKTLEGLALRGGAIVLGLWAVWTAGRPLVHHVFPEFGATMAGPQGFPVTLHVGEDNIAFTNGATEAWTCQAALGISSTYSATFSLEPKQTRALSYRGFRGTDDRLDPAVVRRAARKRVTVACRESSGRAHFVQF